MMGATALQLT